MININNKLHSFTKAITICKLIIKAGGEVRFIGGCIRDSILNKQIADVDLATNLLPQEVQNILAANNLQYFTIGKEFGTITAVVDQEQIEITSLRKDLSCDGRHAKVEFTNSWEEDAQRRDFTINALSADLDGNIYDYFNGLADLKAKKVRFIGNSEDRICEDYLRILRFFRFSAYFANNIDEEGLASSIKYANQLKNISSTRIKNELSKIFIAPNSIAIIKAMGPILEQVFPSNLRAIKSLEQLCLITKNFHYQPSSLVYFAILLYHCDQAEYFIKNFAFTRLEQTILKKIISSKITSWDYASLKQYWCKYKDNFKEVILVNLATQKEDLNLINSLLTSNLEKLFSQSIKILPIKGSDILKLGIEPGEDLGKLLIVADQIWYDLEFSITKDELLKKILPYVNKP